MILIGVDIGGSHVGVGFLDSNDNSRNMLSVTNTKISNNETVTPQDIINIITTEIDIFKSANEKSDFDCKIKSIGIGIPGQCKNDHIVGCANLPLFKNVPLVRMLNDALLDGSISVHLLNDADAAVAAEVWGQENLLQLTSSKNIAMITIGTGIGLGLVLNGSLYQGSNGLIEGGHMIVCYDTDTARKCPCGQYGCIEAYCSASSTVKRYNEKNANLAVVSKASEVRNSKEVFDRAVAGDKVAKDIIEESAEYLAILCINLCRVVDLDVIILGGGMAAAGDSFLQAVKSAVLRRTWTILETNVDIVLSKTSGESGILGACVASTHIKNKPSSNSPSARFETPKKFRRWSALSSQGDAVNELHNQLQHAAKDELALEEKIKNLQSKLDRNEAEYAAKLESLRSDNEMLIMQMMNDHNAMEKSKEIFPLIKQELENASREEEALKKNIKTLNAELKRKNESIELLLNDNRTLLDKIEENEISLELSREILDNLKCELASVTSDKIYMRNMLKKTRPEGESEYLDVELLSRKYSNDIQNLTDTFESKILNLEKKLSAKQEESNIQIADFELKLSTCESLVTSRDQEIRRLEEDNSRFVRQTEGNNESLHRANGTIISLQAELAAISEQLRNEVDGHKLEAEHYQSQTDIYKQAMEHSRREMDQIKSNVVKEYNAKYQRHMDDLHEKDKISYLGYILFGILVGYVLSHRLVDHLLHIVGI